MKSEFSSEYIKSYLKATYNEIRHNSSIMEYTSRVIATRYDCCPKKVFHFMIENKKIPHMNTHILFFITKKGRIIKEEFTEVYIRKMTSK